MGTKSLLFFLTKIIYYGRWWSSFERQLEPGVVSARVYSPPDTHSLVQLIYGHGPQHVIQDFYYKIFRNSTNKSGGNHDSIGSSWSSYNLMTSNAIKTSMWNTRLSSLNSECNQNFFQRHMTSFLVLLLCCRVTIIGLVPFFFVGRRLEGHVCLCGRNWTFHSIFFVLFFF